MTIENIINLIDAKLLNRPKITKVESCTIYPSKVEMGDLFFAMDSSDIQKAVDNGAYAIVFEDSIDISNFDNQIAYLKVDSIKEATLKFLRYIAIQKEIKIYLLDDIEVSFLKLISSKNSIFSILPNSLQKSFETIINSDYEIFVTNSLELALSISSNYLEIEPKVDGYLIEDTLLISTFKIEKYYYQNKELSPIFFDKLRAVVSFCKDNGVEYNINNIKYTNEFRPFYVNNKLEVTPKYLSQKIIIFSNNLEYIEDAYNYIKEQKSWTKTVILTPKDTKLNLLVKPIWVENAQNAIKELKNNFYNIAFCYNLNYKEILNQDDSPKLFT